MSFDLHDLLSDTRALALTIIEKNAMINIHLRVLYDIILVLNEK